jgi:hypothetical protein
VFVKLGELVYQQGQLEKHHPDDLEDVRARGHGAAEVMNAGGDADHEPYGEHDPVGSAQMNLEPGIEPMRTDDESTDHDAPSPAG